MSNYVVTDVEWALARKSTDRVLEAKIVGYFLVTPRGISIADG